MSKCDKIVRVMVAIALSAVLSLPAAMNKITLSNQFFSEGVAFGDLNNDGINDIVAGPVWWQGPTFTVRHTIRQLDDSLKLVELKDDAYDPLKYSNSFINWIRDLDGDGWNDVLMIGVPSDPLYCYRNPGTSGGEWQRVTLWDQVDNESPQLLDIDGDGYEELICNYGGAFGYLFQNPEDPLATWQFRAVSVAGNWTKYTHGIGAGDVNGDGLLDLLTSHGWYEHANDLGDGAVWLHHPQQFRNPHKKKTKGGAQMFAYDVDGDGRNDVITSGDAHGYGLYWYRNIDDASFEQQVIMSVPPAQSPTGVSFSQPHALALVDMNNDGLKDIVTGKRYWAHGPKGDPEPNAPAVLYVFQLVRDQQGASFQPVLIDDDSGVGTQFQVGDLDGDGDPDIIIANKKGVFAFVADSAEQ